jgi:predicted patatin/cPLA2 family phospholipase
MNSDQIAAAILAAAYVSAQRQALSSGVVEENLRQKYVEFLEFVRAQSGSAPAKKKK